MKLKLLFLFYTFAALSLNAQMLITGVVDGPLSGGVPKAIEFYVYQDIPDLSIFGFGSANNGGGSDGQEFTFPTASASAGTFIYVASESTGFNDFFGFNPDYTSTAASINGDDAIELFQNGAVFDVFGDINVDGTGQPWEYTDGWAYRNNQTGPDGSTFVLSNWFFSGPNALDGETSNSTAATPFPIGTYSYGAATIPDAPVATVATNVAHDSFTANWNASTGATTYFLDVSELSDFSTFVTGYNNKDVGNVTSSSVTSLNSSTNYFYRVRASNSAGTSSNSNVITVTTAAPPVTTVQFKNSSGSVLETSGTYNLDVTISYPSSSTATTADVVLISGDPADIDGYTTQTVTFPAGSSSDQTVVISITNDGITEGDETLTFELQNVNGGNSATVGTPSQFDLTIMESHAGNYYDSIDTTATGDELKFELHNLIKGHVEYPYSSSGTDVWDIVMDADQDPNNANNVILIYTGRSQAKSYNASTSGSDPDAWNREHVWAKSRGDFGTDPGPGTDVHHIKAADASVNSSRSNKDFDNGGNQVVDGSTPIDCYTDSDSWEPRDEVKGDVARMIFYMDVRYEGGRGEPDLYLLDTTIANPNKDPEIGKLSTLLQWNQQDPPDAFELRRNDVVYSYQQNRNPFIDHPEWVDKIWGTAAPISPTIANVSRNIKIPAANQNLIISADVTDNGSVSTVLLKYTIDDNPEQSIPMSLTSGNTYSGTIPESQYNDGNYLSYYVYAEDNEGNPKYGTVDDLFTGTTDISTIHSVMSDGRLNYDGVMAQIMATSTVSTGTFSSTSLDVFVQDSTGGISIYKAGDDTTSVTRDNNYKIIGVIDQFNGKTEIVPEVTSTDITDLGAGTTILPQTMTMTQLLSNAEGYEGMLVKIYNVSKISGTWGAGASLTVTDDGGADSLTLHLDSSSDFGNNPEPSWPVDIVGIFSQYDDFYPYTDKYQILPRKMNDFSNSVAVQIKIFLQGPYNASSDNMNTNLNSAIPKTSPYSEDPRTIQNIPADIVDWVLVQIRTTENGPAVTSHSALLNKDGRIVADDGTTGTIRLTADPGQYYIVVKHRNHLPVMSKTKVQLNN